MDNKFIAVVNAAYVHLYNNKEKVNNLNVFPVPDGDTGTNMSLTLKHALDEVTNVNPQTLAQAASACSQGALMGARGNSGVILSQLIRGFAKSVNGKETLNVSDFTLAMRSATDRAYKAVMKPTEGTILTVVREMTEFIEVNYTSFTDVKELFVAMIQAGKESLRRTPELLEVLKEAGVVDSGGAGLIYILEGILNYLNGVEEKLGEGQEEIAAEETSYKYSANLYMKVKDERKYEEKFLEKLKPFGDEILVLQEDDLVKTSINTDEPWTVMKTIAKYGDFVKIRIENNDVTEEVQEPGEAKKVAYDKTHKDYIVVAVSAGQGLSEILTSLGVDYIISGGQTMNPSTQDFLEVIENTDADNYILLPNNSNIILAANQASSISPKNVGVVETKNIPQAISALMNYDPSAELSENISAMAEVIAQVKEAEVTYAVRDTVSNNVEVKKDDIIGITGKAIVSATKDLTECVKATVASMVQDEELISLYFGEDVKQEEADELATELSQIYPDKQVECFNGGQPLYYYIISAE